MPRWRACWAAAQITGVLVSSYCWLLLALTSVPATAAIALIGVGYLVGRTSRAGMWWRFGARPATSPERNRMLAATVPITALRGRHEPIMWIGQRMNNRAVVVVGDRHIVVGAELLQSVAMGALADEHVSSLVAHALGQRRVHGSALVAAAEAYCLPWTLVAIVVEHVGRAVRRIPLLPLAWKARWLVFGMALIDSARGNRWLALVGVALIALLSWSTGYLQRRWAMRMHVLGQRRVAAEGFAPAPAWLLGHVPGVKDGRSVSRDFDGRSPFMSHGSGWGGGHYADKPLPPAGARRVADTDPGDKFDSGRSEW